WLATPRSTRGSQSRPRASTWPELRASRRRCADSHTEVEFMSTTIERAPSSPRHVASSSESVPARPAVTPVPPPAVSEPPAATPKRRNPIPFVIAGVVLLAMVGFGLRQYVFGRTHVSSDNAQVEGHIVPVLPKAAGFVTEVHVRDNQQVKAGDVL